MIQLTPISSTDDISPIYRDNPIGLLLEYHNLNRAPKKYKQARLLIGTCMDHRIRLQIPENFAYIIRAAGANFRQKEFQIEYAIAVGGVRAIALIAHTDCGMVNLHSRRGQFVQGLVEVTEWDKKLAEESFMHSAPKFGILNEMEFVDSEAKRLRKRYPGIQIAPMLYRVEDHLLYLIRES